MSYQTDPTKTAYSLYENNIALILSFAIKKKLKHKWL